MRYREFMSLLAAAVLAAIVASLVFIIPTLAQVEEPWNIVVVTEMLGLARTTLIVALAHALVLGLPLFLLLRSITRVGIVVSGLGGFLVGAAPFGVLDWISMHAGGSAWTGGKATVANGVPTLAGWIEYARDVGSIGLLGLAGGLTFWIAMRVSGYAPGERNDTRAQSPASHAGSSSIVALALFLTAYGLATAERGAGQQLPQSLPRRSNLHRAANPCRYKVERRRLASAQADICRIQYRAVPFVSQRRKAPRRKHHVAQPEPLRRSGDHHRGGRSALACSHQFPAGRSRRTAERL